LVEVPAAGVEREVEGDGVVVVVVVGLE
jgi:hypothetical protein